ncbi:MAG: hypothetical protein LUI09_00600 [Prevotellaceae bacterium]|nr:hypothetical protein [Prevotellaceae bacterium]
MLDNGVESGCSEAKDSKKKASGPPDFRTRIGYTACPARLTFALGLQDIHRFRTHEGQAEWHSSSARTPFHWQWCREREKKNWVITAIDYSRSKKEKGITANPPLASHGAEGEQSSHVTPRNPERKGRQKGNIQQGKEGKAWGGGKKKLLIGWDWSSQGTLLPNQGRAFCRKSIKDALRTQNFQAIISSPSVTAQKSFLRNGSETGFPPNWGEHQEESIAKVLRDTIQPKEK